MSISIILLGFLVFLTFSLTLYFIWMELNKKELDPKLVKNANAKISKTSKLDPNLSLIESHKIMTNTLKTMFKNKKLNSAKILNKVSKNFKDEKAFWYYHRMRNKAAHEDDFVVSKTDAEKARKIFQDALKTVAV
jgi:hypothetical protein